MIRLRWTTSHPIADEITRNRLNDMRKGGLLTDMTLTSGLRIYPCHKIIIANASPFIRDVIQMATVLSKDDTVVVSIDGKYSQQMDHLMQFLYLGVLTIDPRWLHDLCKLGDKLHIKFLVDGVDGPLLHPLQSLAHPARVEVMKRTAAGNHEPSIKKKRQRKMGEKNLQKPKGMSKKLQHGKGKEEIVKNGVAQLKKTVANPEPQPHCSKNPPKNIWNDYTTPKMSSSSNSNNVSMAKRLKKKALNFLASGQVQAKNSSFKHIPRRKQRIVKNGKPEISVLIKELSPGLNKGQMDAGDVDGGLKAIHPTDQGRQRRKAYLKAGDKVKLFISQIQRRKN